ncbi:MAG TPA: DinB family protein [Bryobacteraceae bacterium]|nr:DinB family protein [Bryobacteraceae bacterium]
MLTDLEREKALGLLNRSRQTLLDSLEGVSENQARWKPALERWSILEYVEHLAISDDGLIAIIQRSLKMPARPETEEQRRERDAKLKQSPIPRGANRAPEILQPHSRFASLAEAKAAFLNARERSLEFARSCQDDIRSHFSDHDVLGPLDGYQWLMGNARHAETHAGHIRELRGMPDFPQS